MVTTLTLMVIIPDSWGRAFDTIPEVVGGVLVTHSHPKKCLVVCLVRQCLLSAQPRCDAAMPQFGLSACAHVPPVKTLVDIDWLSGELKED